MLTIQRSLKFCGLGLNNNICSVTIIVQITTRGSSSIPFIQRPTDCKVTRILLLISVLQVPCMISAWGKCWNVYLDLCYSSCLRKQPWNFNQSQVCSPHNFPHLKTKAKTNLTKESHFPHKPLWNPKIHSLSYALIYILLHSSKKPSSHQNFLGSLSQNTEEGPLK